MRNMGRCLYCFKSIDVRLTWRRLFFLEKDPVLCEECSSKLNVISDPICPMCGRQSEKVEYCTDCAAWETHPDYHGVIKKNRSVFQYNEFMKEVLARFKFRGDAILAQMFSEPFVKAFHHHFDKSMILVPIPLGEERLLERGFNQAKLLAQLLQLPIIEPLRKTDAAKQSKKSRIDRMKTKNMFTVTDPKQVHGQHIVIIDDIYTTGATVRQAAKQLMNAGAKSVESFTLVRS